MALEQLHRSPKYPRGRVRVVTVVQINGAQSANHHLLGSVTRTNLERGYSLLYRFLGMGAPVCLSACPICGRLRQPHVHSLGQRGEWLEVRVCDDRNDVRYGDSAA